MKLVLIVILIFVNAFFAASEMAFVSLNDTKLNRMAKNGNKKAEKIVKMLVNPSRFLASNILRIEKYNANKVWTAILFDADNQGYPYLKRFLMDASKKKQNWLSDNPASKLILLTDTAFSTMLYTGTEPRIIYGVRNVVMTDTVTTTG